MFQVRISGRAGHGVVAATELLTAAALIDGWQVKAIPAFSDERVGAAPVAMFRLSTVPVTTQWRPEAPDAVIIEDPELTEAGEPFTGLPPDGWAVVNTRLSPDQIREATTGAPHHLATVPGDDIVREYLGPVIPGPALVGAFAALTNKITLDAVLAVLASRYDGAVAQGSVRSAQVAHQWVTDRLDDPEAASPVGGFAFQSSLGSP